MTVGALVVCLALAITALLAQRLIAPALPLATGTLMLLLLCSHAAAQRRARVVEVARSFAGTVVRHGGHMIRVDSASTVVGEYQSRRTAARAALR